MDHQFLRIEDRHLGSQRARGVVLEQLACVFGGNATRVGKDDPIPLPGGGVLPSFRELVALTTRTGAPGPLQHLIDVRDSVFGGVEHMATNSEVLGITIRVADRTRSVQGPASTAPACSELADDILEFRKRICAASMRAEIAWPDLGRNYRGFLFAGCAIVEAFLNRHLVQAAASGINTSSVGERDSFSQRIESWVELFAPERLPQIKSSAAWSQQTEIRDLRNEILHGREPTHGISLQAIPRFLNYARLGIGDLLCRLQEVRGGPRLGFMLRLRSAPEVSFFSYRDTLSST